MNNRPLCNSCLHVRLGAWGQRATAAKMASFPTVTDSFLKPKDPPLASPRFNYHGWQTSSDVNLPSAKTLSLNNGVQAASHIWTV
jgi:hypothetical protein